MLPVFPAICGSTNTTSSIESLCRVAVKSRSAGP